MMLEMGPRRHMQVLFGYCLGWRTGATHLGTRIEEVYRPTPRTVGERAAQIRWICAWRDRPGGERWAEKALFSAIATEISNLVTFDTVLCENEQQFGISASQMQNLFA